MPPPAIENCWLSAYELALGNRFEELYLRVLRTDRFLTSPGVTP